MKRPEPNKRIEEVFRDPRLVEAAIKRGVADAARRYAQAGLLMATLKEGRVVWVDPVTFEEVAATPNGERISVEQAGH